MCQPAPVAAALWDEVSRKYEGRVQFLGIVGDQAHSVRTSSHNCAPNQESGDYHPNFAHALDIGHHGDRGLAAEIRNVLLGDRRTRYVIDNGTGYYPTHRGGGTFRSSGHTTHLHVSFQPGTTFDTKPFLGPGKMTSEVRARITRLAKEAAAGRRLLEWKRGRPRQRGRDVRELQTVLNRPVKLPYGPGTAKAVSDLQRFLNLPATGKVNRPTWEAVLYLYIARGFGY